jgi:hypothetical protein
MALLWLSCPHCRVFFHIDDSNAGRQVTCRACGNPIRIPGAAPKSSVWYYTRDHKPVGPVTFEQLKERARAGEVAPHEFVWQEGMAQWAEARSIDGLYPTPPPLPPSIVAEARVKQAESDTTPVQVIEDEPAIEIVEDEPIAPPVAAEPEPPLLVTPDAGEPAAAAKAEAPLPSAPANWDVVENRAATTDQPLPVEPEFTIDFAAAPAPPVRRAEPPPTVDLVFPTEVAVGPADIPHDIALTPIEPKMELGEPEPTGPPVPYGIAAWNGPSAEVVAVPGAAAPPPEAYPVVGESRPAAADTNIMAATAVDDSGSPPMAIPVSPAELRPRRETEAERNERLRQEYRRERAAWTKVRTGISLIYLAQAFWFAVIAGSMLIGTAIAVFAGESMSESQDSGAGSTIMTVLLLVLALAVDTLSTAGFAYCLKVPETAGSRVLAITAVALTGIAIFGAFVAAFVPVLRLFVLGIGFARWIVFLFFLQTVAQFFESHYLLRSIERLLLLLTGTVGVGVLLWVGMAFLSKVFAKSDSDTAAVVTMTCATLCTSLPLLVLLGLSTMRYLRVMRDTVAIIDERLYRG